MKLFFMSTNFRAGHIQTQRKMFEDLGDNGLIIIIVIAVIVIALVLMMRKNKTKLSETVEIELDVEPETTVPEGDSGIVPVPEQTDV